MILHIATSTGLVDFCLCFGEILAFYFIAIKTKYTLFSINSWNLGTLAAATTQFRFRAT